jgi:hypothetical protein
MPTLIDQGVLLESARGPVPNVAELIAGEPVRGSWWAHRSSHAIFDALNELAGSPDTVRTRLIGGKVTIIHRRLWPALVRLTDRLPVERLSALSEEHTPTGAHRVTERPFPDWVPSGERRAGRRLSTRDAQGALPTAIAALLSPSEDTDSPT